MLGELKSELKPVVSLTLILATLFSVVFVKMEVRRRGYSLLKVSREYKQAQDRYHMKIIEYAKVNRPERIRDFAMTRLTLNQAKSGQIIQMSGDRIAIQQ